MDILTQLTWRWADVGMCWFCELGSAPTAMIGWTADDVQAKFTVLALGRAFRCVRDCAARLAYLPGGGGLCLSDPAGFPTGDTAAGPFGGLYTHTQ